MKKIILIIIIVIILILVGVLLFLKTDSTSTSVTIADKENFPSGEVSVGQNTESSNTDSNAPFPINNDTTQATFPGSDSVTGTTDNPNNLSRQAKRISDGPVSGATSFGTLKDVNLTIRYLDSSTGNVWDYRPLGNERKRITVATIPRVKEVYWGNRGQSVLLRYVDETEENVKNYLLRIPVSSTGASQIEIEGSFLHDSILSVTSGPTGNEVLSCPDYLTKTLRTGARNDPAEVRRLQNFLINYENFSSLKETGLYDSATEDAVKIFQERYKDIILRPNGLSAGTGTIGASTKTYINKLYCNKVGGRVVGGKIFFTSNDGSKTTGAVVDFDNKKTTPVFSSAFSEFSVFWPNNKTLVLSTTPSAKVPGFAYTAPAVSIETYSLFSSLQPLIRDISGLTINPSPDLANVIYSKVISNGFTTKILDVKTGENRTFPVITLPKEKCVWDKKDTNIIYCAVPKGRITSGEPDNWYLGLSSFSDDVYRIDVVTDTLDLIYSSQTESPDISLIGLSEDNTFLYFIDQNDNYLWALSLVNL